MTQTPEQIDEWRWREAFRLHDGRISGAATSGGYVNTDLVLDYRRLVRENALPPEPEPPTQDHTTALRASLSDRCRIAEPVRMTEAQLRVAFGDTDFANAYHAFRVAFLLAGGQIKEAGDVG